MIQKSRVIPPITNIVILAFFIGVIANMPYVVWGPFANELGAPFAFIGITATIAELGYALFQPLSGRLSDTIGRKIILSISTSIFVIGSVLFTLITEWFWILPSLFIFRVGSSFFDPGYHASTDEASGPARRGRSFGYAWAFRISGGAIGGIIAGFVAYYYSIPTVFWVIIGLVIILLIIIQTVPDRRIKNNEDKIIIKNNKTKNPANGKMIKKILIVCSIDAFAWSIYGLIFYAMLNDSFGITTAELGIITFVQYASLVPVQILFGYLSDRLGRKAMFLISEAVGILTIIGYIFSSEFISFLLLQIPMAIVGASFIVGFYPILMDYAQIDKKAEVLGRFSFLRGILSIPGPTIGGIIYSLLGYQMTMTTSLLLVGLTLLLMIFLLPNKDHNNIDNI